MSLVTIWSPPSRMTHGARANAAHALRHCLVEPMTKVAADFGVSDVALKKICDKHRVPSPPRGYWAKKEAGGPVQQVCFHATDDPQHERVVRTFTRQLPRPRKSQGRQRQSNQLELFAHERCPPKAEVAGSNPVGCAIYVRIINNLYHWYSEAAQTYFCREALGKHNRPLQLQALQVGGLISLRRSLASSNPLEVEW